MAAPQQQPLQASVSEQIEIAPEKTLQDVIDLNGGETWWGGLADTDKNEVATQYRAKYLDPQLSKLPEPDQNEILTQFNQKYGVGGVQPTNNILENILKGTTTANLAVGSVLSPATSAFGFGSSDPNLPRQMAAKRFPGIQSDPGLLGQAYRFNSNPVANMAGGILGNVAGAGKIIGGLAQTGLKQTPRLLNATAAGIQSGLTNIGDILQGEQSPLEALGNTAFQTVTAPLAGSNRWLNGLVQGGVAGAGGAASSALDDFANNRTLNVKRALDQAMREGAVGAGLGLAMGQSAPAKAKPRAIAKGRVKGFEYAQAVGKRQGGKFTTQDTAFTQANQKLVAGIKQSQSVNEQQTLQGQLRKLKKQVEVLDSVSRNEAAPYYSRQTAKKLKEQTTAEYNKIQQEYNSKYQPQKVNKKTTASKQQVEQAIQAGIRARAKGGRVAAQYENYINTFDPNYKRLINAEIKARQQTAKTKAAIEKERATVRREKGVEKAKTITKTREEVRRETVKQQNELIRNEKAKQAAEKKTAKEQQTAQNKEAAARAKRLKEIESARKKANAEELKRQNAEKRAQTKAERDKATADRKRAAEEKKRLDEEEKAIKQKDKEAEDQRKKADKLSKAPDVLDNADIERKSNELIGHVEKKEQGTLDAKLSYYRKAAKEDLTKYGLSKERGQAINTSYQKLLDAYAQKKTASTEKPSASTLKAGQEANRLELSKLNEQGGRYNPGDANARQRPAKGLTLEDAQRTREWDNLDPETQRKARIAMEAAEGDSDVIIEYDAERSGDTGQFKLKTVSPLSLDFVNGELVMHATNTNGHTGMYYLSPSKPNAKTGMASFTHEITPLDESIGKAKQGLDANIYWGQRDVSTADILKRPKRETAGYTSELEAKLRNAYGQDANQLKRTLEKRIKKKQKVSPQEITDKAPVLQDDDLAGVYETMDKAQKKENWEEKTGDEC